MSNCKNCGAELPENGKFCTKCGTKVEEQPVVAAPVQETPVQETPVAPVAPAAPVAKEKKPVNKKLFIIIGAAVLALIIIVVVIVCIANVIKKKQETEAKTIKFKEEYLEVIFDGYEGMGVVDASINREEFRSVAYKAMGYGKNSKSEKAAEEFLELIYGIDIQIDKDNLSNGDEVTVKIVADPDVMDEVDVILKDVEFKYTVEGLQTVEMYNPFDDLEIEMSGMDGDVYVDWYYNGDNDYISSYSFDCDDYYGLSVGDKFTITFDEYTAETLLDAGFMVTETEKTYTVDAADSYIEDYDDISEDLLEAIKDVAEEEFIDQYDGGLADCSLDSYEYIGMYVLSEKDYANSIGIVVYKGVVSSDEDEYEPVEVYMAVRVDDLINYADGTQGVDDYGSFMYNTEYVGDSYEYIYGYLSEKDLYDDVLTYTYNLDDYDVDFGGDVTDYSTVNEEETEDSENVDGEETEDVADGDI